MAGDLNIPPLVNNRIHSHKISKDIEDLHNIIYQAVLNIYGIPQSTVADHTFYQMYFEHQIYFSS